MQEENQEIQSQFNVTDPVKKNLKGLFVKPIIRVEFLWNMDIEKLLSHVSKFTCNREFRNLRILRSKNKFLHIE